MGVDATQTFSPSFLWGLSVFVLAIMLLNVAVSVMHSSKTSIFSKNIDCQREREKPGIGIQNKQPVFLKPRNAVARQSLLLLSHKAHSTLS